jgi:hypothetical protein
MNIVVASIGRSGSDMLTSAIKESFPIMDVMFAATLSQLESFDNMIIKTHDLPPKVDSRIADRSKFLFIWGDPVSAQISAHKQPDEFIRLHYMHLAGDYERRFEWPDRDTLGLRRNFDEWFLCDYLDLFFVNYERLWPYENQLSEFVGRKVVLPEFQERTTTIDHSDETHRRVLNTFMDFRGFLATIPPFIIKRRKC